MKGCDTKMLRYISLFQVAIKVQIIKPVPVHESVVLHGSVGNSTFSWSLIRNDNENGKLTLWLSQSENGS